MKIIPFLILQASCLLSCWHVFASKETSHIMLTQAIKERKVKVCAEGLGGYQKKCLFLSIANNTSAPLSVMIDPAMVFRPVDTFQQDLVITGDELIVLAPREVKGISLNAFCGKSYAHSPRRNMPFQFLKQGDSAMIAVARYIKANNLYDHAGQAAIWSFTNRHTLGNIYDVSNPKRTAGLASLVSKLTGRPIPEYYTLRKIRKEDTGAVYVEEISKLFVELNWQYNPHANQHVYIYKSDGTLYKEMKDGERIAPTGHHIRIVFDPEKDPLDTYTVYVKDDNNYVYARKKVLVSLE